ncbi:MAG: hypothetical protein JW936_09160 [Sedimentisphaerales bacterium]|nr:hypothetical protein [Sedimentisphaerales bacterium]
MKNCLLIFALVLICGVSSIAHAELIEWFETWEDSENNPSYGPWTYGGGGAGYWNFFTDASTPDGDYYLRFPLYNGKSAARTIGTSTTTDFTVSFYYKGVGNGGWWNCNLFRILDSSNVPLCGLEMRGDADGTRIYLGADLYATVPYDQWAKLEMVVSRTDGTTTVYVDDVLLGSYPLGGAPDSIASTCYMQHCGDSTHVGYIDAITVARTVPTVCGDGNTEYNLGDISGADGQRDCRVNIADFAAFADQWGFCADPENPDCDQYWDGAYAWYWDGDSSSTGTMEVWMGNDEYENLELTCEMLRNMPYITLEVDAVPTFAEGAVSVGIQDGVSNPETAYLQECLYAIDYDPNSTSYRMPTSLGQIKSFWIELNSRYITPGDYTVNLSLVPALGPAEVIPITLHVMDISRADQDQASMYMYHTLSYISGAAETHATLLQRHYVDRLMLHFPFDIWTDAINVTRSSGNLNVNFSGFDDVVEPYINGGFDDVGLMAYLYKEEWFSALDYESEAQKLITRAEFGDVFVDHLNELGFGGPGDSDDITIYALEEPDLLTMMDSGTHDDLAWLQNVNPNFKTLGTLNHYSTAAMNSLNPYLDVLCPAIPTVELLLADIADNDVVLDAGDRVGYYGACSYFSGSDAGRAMGWRAAFLSDITYFGVFAYNQSPNNPDWKLFVNGLDGVPRTTPALEGLRDGFEDFGYWKKFDADLALASAIPFGSLSPAEQADLTSAQGFRAAVFSTDPSALVQLELTTYVVSIIESYDYHEFVAPDCAVFRDVKGMLLSHIAALEDIIAAH